MIQNITIPTTSRRRKYNTPESRWAGIGPYYAMFPTSFADEVVKNYTRPGDAVLDPFAGRGTAIFSAAIQKRPATGIEINPLGYVYANAKLNPGAYKDVTRRLEELARNAHCYRQAAYSLPKFFHLCFTDKVLEFLLAARASLKWRRSKTDRTLMALILISLHGKRHQSLSNQMRQSTAMAPAYCIRWWIKKDLTPPDIDPVSFIQKRIDWRYVHGIPNIKDASVFLADSLHKLPVLARDVKANKRLRAKLLLTSPPYHNVTNYYYDQWLRLWLLGCSDIPGKQEKRYGGKFSNLEKYCHLLNQVFARAKPILADDAIIYIRTDQRESTLKTTRAVLTEIFPEKQITETLCPLNPTRQTKPYSRGGAPKKTNCEVDLILEPR